MTLRFQNAHFWRPIQPKGELAFPGDVATTVKTVVKASVPVTVTLIPADGDGWLGDPIFVGYIQAGDTPLWVSHGTGFILAFDFQKAGYCSIYDDREETSAVAPVGDSFTNMEKMGLRMEDPLQVLVHQDGVRRRLESMLAQPVDPNQARVAELEATIASLTKFVQEKFPVTDPDTETSESSAE